VARRTLLAAAVLSGAVVTLSGSPSSILARPSASRAPLTRYSLVHGCFRLTSPGGRAEIGAGHGPFRMQAAALGVYLLYGPAGEYLSDDGAGGLQAASTASAASEWRVTGDARRGFSATNLATSKGFRVKFTPASGCATYPEAQVDASGSSPPGASPEADVLGTVEGHAHITAFEFFGGDWHCGSPWSPFGAPYALPASCADKQQGTNGQVEDFIDFGGQPRPSDMHGWPTFVQWPSPTALAEEGDYYTGIERAWKAGLRLMVTNLVDNEALCGIMTTRHNPCNDMASVHIQSRDLFALQDYVDAQSGGPGKGWFRVVTDPFQARRVINQGKLAVIEGIEVSRLFGCGEQNNVPQCDQSQVDAGLKEVRALGVRTFFPVHEFDNAFGGSKMIAGDQGLIINAGNRTTTGSFFSLEPCPADQQDAAQYSVAPADSPATQLLNGPLASTLGGSPTPVYGPPPQCNTRGLTDLGAYLITQMARQRLIIQTDHMDSKTASAAVGIAEAHHYAGVVSAHCCSSPQLFHRIYALGGFVNPPTMPPTALVGIMKQDRAVRVPRFRFGFGWGSDENGLGDQPGPTAPAISYPFKSYDGRVSFTQEQWGQRSFNLNTDGVANYGMYADWLRQLQIVGGAPAMNDMFQGAEAYLEMWERAYGVPAARCRARGERFSARGLGKTLRLGDSTQAALYRAGQPSSRVGRSYRYCAARGRGRVAAVFNRSGRVALIVSTVPGDRAGRVTVGNHLRAAGASGSYFYGLSSGRVRFIAVASRTELSSRTRLSADLRAAGI
jgi:hypothetical protein